MHWPSILFVPLVITTATRQGATGFRRWICLAPHKTCSRDHAFTFTVRTSHFYQPWTVDFRRPWDPWILLPTLRFCSLTLRYCGPTTSETPHTIEHGWLSDTGWTLSSCRHNGALYLGRRVRSLLYQHRGRASRRQIGEETRVCR